MVLVIILLIFSVSLNVALLFGMVRKNADEDMKIIRKRDVLFIERTEDFSTYESNIPIKHS